MITSLPTVTVREWSKTEPSQAGAGAPLRDLALTDADRDLLSELGRTSLKVRELRHGLMIETGPHVGTVTLSCLRIVVMPKLKLNHLMRMVAYAFDLSNLSIASSASDLATKPEGLVDLLALSLLHHVQRIVRGGLLSRYVGITDDLNTVRGRLELRHIMTHPKSTTLRCTFDELTADHQLNQVLAAGLRLASVVIASRDLSFELARAADRFFGDLKRIRLSEQMLREAVNSLDRRSRHYQTALGLVALLYHGARLGEHDVTGDVQLSSFLLDMNVLFERFLERWLREHAPADVTVTTQDVRSDVFTYLEKPPGWKQPTIRPDLVFTRRGEVIALGDAKYKNRHEHPPSTSELYQLTTYGLSYDMPEPREVMLFHPIIAGSSPPPGRLLFAPPAAQQKVKIRLVGVPVDDMVSGRAGGWWPIELPAFRCDQ